jgi:protein involved in polysaccharide export with SLBB domain
VRPHATVKLDHRLPEINWSYAVIERQDPRDLTTQLIAFHPGKLVLERDRSQDLELRPGDVVTVFSQADIRVPVAQQNRFVRLEGEFQTAGIYNIRPGETLAEVVARAGGFTREAYLYGAEFTRVSVKQEQQRRLEQFANELEREIDEIARNQLAAMTSEKAAEVSARLAYERRFVQNLRSIQATGRIVLQLDPDKPDLSRLLALPLEDGDRLYVPPRPSTVHVIGSVFNPNTFLHERGTTVSGYLAKAGGLTRSADARRLFIIRADGTVVARGGATGLGGRKFENLRLSPGDAVVAPEFVLKTSVWKSVREWSQVAAQFALGAAAVNVLR